MKQAHVIRLGLGVAVLSAVVVLIPGVAAYNDCSATVKGDLMRTEVGKVETTLGFKVDITVQEDCATVYYELVTKEESPNGESQVKKKPMKTRLRNGQTSKGIKFKHRNENKLVSWSFDIVECRKCE